VKGIGASPGIAISKVFVLKHENIVINMNKVDHIQTEISKLKEAIEYSKIEISEIKKKATKELGEEEAKIFEAHLMILDDPEYIGQIEQIMTSEKITADNAATQITNQFVEIFGTMDDEYMKGRAVDIKDVGRRLIRNILGVKAQNLSEINEDVIIIANDLTPSDTAQMNKQKVKGFATDIGGRTSHTAIMARSLEIPAVLGLHNITSQVKEGDLIIVDGLTGEVIIHPEESVVKSYRGKKAQYESARKELEQLKDLAGVTKDGHLVELVGNIGTPNDIEGVIKNGGQGVGLYRTEFLYMDSDVMPSEEKQFAAYKSVVEGLKDMPIIIRTLDIGGDKKLPYLTLDDDMNPFLGLRAIRLCFAQKELFKIQLRAILRASAFGKCLVMFPMISNIDEVRQAKVILEECKRELDGENIDYDKEIKVGIMVEIPSAAICADLIAKEVDFFSIGTNDLCQYTLAVDRMNEKVAYLYQPFNPAILRLVKTVIDASHGQVGKFTGMCGEMAGDPLAALILLGLGLDEFSMSASSIPQIKKIIRSVTLKEAQEIAHKALNLSTADEVKKMVELELKKIDITII